MNEIYIYRCDSCKDVKQEDEPPMELGGAGYPTCSLCVSFIEDNV